ncbi:protein-disulfide reductase DsbD [Thiomicrospira sp. WB1]|uniref:protein-disulfide reductase DsbD n=1 Tax=Thiomicrospira sp. WB1 TaxID=1685380 RepID=UPI0007488349|nr:protein-disulfide reductase DsbD [Thiomicrospira sp. WB1]KUJ72710.1 cytochrome C biogenesis protein [Thiomicrospira sp. WB1]
MFRRFITLTARRFQHVLLGILTVSAFSLAPWQAHANDLLSVDDAFALQPVTAKNGQIHITWDIADGYYLYQKRIKVTSPETTLGPVKFPKAIIKQDPAFGESKVYENDLTVTVSIPEVDAKRLKLEISYQGCAEEQGVCYPPQTRKTMVALPEASAQASPGAIASLDSLQALNDSIVADSGTNLLPEEEAFQFDYQPGTGQNRGMLVLTFAVADGYHLYEDKFKATVKSGQASLGTLQLPESTLTDDPVFGKVAVFHDDFTARLPIGNVLDTAEIELTYQGCSVDAGVCYPPTTKTLTVSEQNFAQPLSEPAMPSAPQTSNDLSESDRITQTLQDSSLWLIIGTFFLFGLLLSLTPCVFPMIPILSSIIVGQGDQITTRRAFTMSLVYVLAMSVTYTVAGVLAGVFGENLQVMFQNPWIIGTFALVFVALAFSMFGFYELQLPASLQNKITQVSNQQKSGTLTGVAIMGFLSALIVGPCVAPPLAGALIYIGQTGDALLGGTALFAMSLGMGVPLLLLGTSAGKLLPRAGAWMDNVKAVFGVLMLALAIWMADRIIPGWATLMLSGLLLIGVGVYLGALEPIGEKSGWHKLFKSLGVISLIYGVIMLVGLASGSNQLLQPLKGLTGTSSGSVQTQALDFKKIDSLQELEAELAKGEPIMLDFYADWCVSCKEMEALTFTDPGVHQALEGVTLLKADVTDNTEVHKALMKHFNIVGPPAILFFKNGQEQKAQRVVGFQNAQTFTDNIQQALK